MGNNGKSKQELVAELEFACQKASERVAKLKGHLQIEGSEMEKLSEIRNIRESEIRYRRLFEAAQDGILILDADSGAITDANPFIKEILGYSRQDLIGKRLWEIGAFFDVIASNAAFEELKRKKYIRYENLPLQTKEGQLREVEFISNVYLVNGKKVIQCNIRDITMRKWLEKDKQKLMDKFHEALTHIKEMNGLLPICSYCKKIRNDKGYWQILEAYIAEHSGATFTHGICEDCAKIYFPNPA